MNVIVVHLIRSVMLYQCEKSFSNFPAVLGLDSFRGVLFIYSLYYILSQFFDSECSYQVTDKNTFNLSGRVLPNAVLEERDTKSSKKNLGRPKLFSIGLHAKISFFI